MLVDVAVLEAVVVDVAVPEAVVVDVAVVDAVVVDVVARVVEAVGATVVDVVLVAVGSSSVPSPSPPPAVVAVAATVVSVDVAAAVDPVVVPPYPNVVGSSSSSELSREPMNGSRPQPAMLDATPARAAANSVRRLRVLPRDMDTDSP